MRKRDERARTFIREWNLLTNDQKLAIMRAAPEFYVTAGRLARRLELSTDE